MTPEDPPPVEPEAEPAAEESHHARRWRRDSEESLIHRFVQVLADAREERRAEPGPIATGPSKVGRADVPVGLDLAAAWGWRLLVIAGASYLLMWLVGYFAVVTIPLAVALLVSALAAPFVAGVQRIGVPRGLAALLVVLSGFAVVGALLTFAGQQVASGAEDLANSTVQGLDEIREWLRDGPLNASDSQINDAIERAQEMITEQTQDGEVVSRVTEFGTAIGHVVAGFFIALFATYFFLADGDRIWGWLVRLAPRAARERVDSSGRVAWVSLVQFVRATVIVAMVDAVGVMIGAAILDVPFVLAIGVLVFLGAFIPLIGATIAGIVAVLVALVDQGPVTALIMLAVLIGVQQLEGHILQPFLLGRWVRLHPLGVIVALAGGVLVAGIVGALVAVPLAAAANAVVLHLAELSSSVTEPTVDEDDDGIPDEAEQGLEPPGAEEVTS
ncbi:putative PurR-regulated permease PerM [Nocardioides thalensis]|uniref:Putative PurR-regulated permease PerM n=1 Tax=Nocardioides thalensis TaxID=1914755 RepID=A0A853BWD4_9ACTN|nr:AI-2E family transporter [Nocardioides thalensis]NYJ00220.1 putative PurR-regulated permease PerM [Nocardioides thalensis]